MKKTTLILLAFLSFTVSFAQDCKWLTIKDYERNYRIDFPNEPKPQSQDVPTEIGTVTMDMLDTSAKTASKNLVYMTAYSAYPSNSDYSDEALQHSMLDGSVDGAVKNVNGKLISSEKIKFNGFNGRLAKISIYNETYIVYLKNILVDNKLYFIQVITNPANDNNNDLQRFFDSFDLIKTK